MNLFDILEIKESYQLTDRLFELVNNADERERVFSEYLKTSPDLSRDMFSDEFQQFHADRDRLNQDFTPPAVARLVAMLTPGEDVRDVCAGSGGLTIAQWAVNPSAFFECEEYSRPALMLLLFNLALRNMHACVRHTDVLTCEVFAAWRLTPGARFSRIEALDSHPAAAAAQAVVSNPPYSAKWTPQKDERFSGFELPPASKADFALCAARPARAERRRHDDGCFAARYSFSRQQRGGNQGAID